MRKNLTELVFILDASGSMADLVDDTIGGFNSMIERQRRESGEALVSTVLFDDESRVIHDRVPLRRVEPLTRAQYAPDGYTALLDAVGGAIRHIGGIHKRARAEDRPARTLFVITTDGMENASRRYGYAQIKEMIERQKHRFDWEFLFLGANIDAAASAARIGIGAERAANYHCDAEGTRLNYEVLGETVCRFRENAPIGSAWAERIRRDFKARSKR